MFLRLSKNSNGKRFISENCFHLSWFNIMDLTNSYLFESQKYILKDNIPLTKIYPPNSLLIAVDGATIGKLGISTTPFVMNSHCCVLSCNDSLEMKYLYYYFLLLNHFNYFSKISHGSIFQGITIENLKSINIPFCSLSEQQELISFLDQKYHLIQELLSKIDLLLKRLEDYQASIIYEKIYQKSYPRKKANSYISILGGVPCSYDPKGFIPVYGSGGIFQKTNQILYSGESVLVGRKGTLNKPFYLSSSSQFWIVDTVYCIQNKNPLFLNLKYFYYFYCSLNFKEFQSGSVLPSMTQSSILSLLLPLPSLIQQNAIVSELDSKICLLSQLQHYYQSLRAHLEEYQESLLYETFQHLL